MSDKIEIGDLVRYDAETFEGDFGSFYGIAIELNDSGHRCRVRVYGTTGFFTNGNPEKVMSRSTDSFAIISKASK